MTGVDYYYEHVAQRAVYESALLELLAQSLVAKHLPEGKGLTTPCIEWQGHRLAEGYGHAWVTTPFGMREKVYVHRHAFYLYTGRRLEYSELACHRCDNPPCLNVFDHIFVGTSSDNNGDMSKKGRNVAQRPGQFAGERNNHARLTWTTVREMRRQWAEGAYPSKKIGAAAYALHPSTFGDIVEHRTWWPDPEGVTP